MKRAYKDRCSGPSRKQDLLESTSLIGTVLSSDNPIMPWAGSFVLCSCLALVRGTYVCISWFWFSCSMSSLTGAFIGIARQECCWWGYSGDCCHLRQARLPRIICHNLFCPESSFTLKCVKGSTAARQPVRQEGGNRARVLIGG